MHVFSVPCGQFTYWVWLEQLICRPRVERSKLSCRTGLAVVLNRFYRIRSGDLGGLDLHQNFVGLVL